MSRWLLPRLLSLLIPGLSGCSYPYRSDPVPPGPVPCGHCQAERIPLGTPAPVDVSDPPPMDRPEPIILCGKGLAYVRGHWDWNGDWRWVHGNCVPAAPGLVYIPPFYQDGVFVPGYFTDNSYASDRHMFPGYRRIEHPPGTFFNNDPAFWLPFYSRYFPQVLGAASYGWLPAGPVPAYPEAAVPPPPPVPNLPPPPVFAEPPAR